MGELQSGQVLYQAKNGPSIKVRKDGELRIVTIQANEYFIKNVGGESLNNYEVNYPNGHQYKVEDNSGFLLSFDQKGELVTEYGTLYVNGKPIIPGGAETPYSPSQLVTAAYPEYHTKQGSLFLLYLSFFFMILGWCSFRYRKFQDFQFLLSFHWLWVNDPEPSDFYYFMSKVGGVILMGAGVFFFVKSFFA
ncbi:hypothetical protein [Paenibacillus puldeungensis]|uniref:hypothetical protein n=1 Tax=Paenibacillus puldeungensis TaxID=696536 RepID=UPI0036D25442